MVNQLPRNDECTLRKMLLLILSAALSVTELKTASERWLE
jgi:hypothetical protein